MNISDVYTLFLFVHKKWNFSFSWSKISKLLFFTTFFNLRQYKFVYYIYLTLSFILHIPYTQTHTLFGDIAFPQAANLLLCFFSYQHLFSKIDNITKIFPKHSQFRPPPYVYYLHLYGHILSCMIRLKYKMIFQKEFAFFELLILYNARFSVALPVSNWSNHLSYHFGSS